MPESLRSAASFDEWDRLEGTPGKMGVTWIPALSAWNFALYSRRATSVTLLIYSADDPIKPIFEHRLNSRVNKSGPNLALLGCGEHAPGAAYYAYRVDGRHDPGAGYRFDPQKILLDPFAPSVYFPPAFNRIANGLPGPTDGRAPLGVLPRSVPQPGKVIERAPRPAHDLIVYELHVKGFHG